MDRNKLKKKHRYMLDSEDQLILLQYSWHPQSPLGTPSQHNGKVQYRWSMTDPLSFFLVCTYWFVSYAFGIYSLMHPPQMLSAVHLPLGCSSLKWISSSPQELQAMFWFLLTLKCIWAWCFFRFFFVWHAHLNPPIKLVTGPINRFLQWWDRLSHPKTV